MGANKTIYGTVQFKTHDIKKHLMRPSPDKLSSMIYTKLFPTGFLEPGKKGWMPGGEACPLEKSCKKVWPGKVKPPL